MYGEIPDQVEVGAWLRVPYSGHPLARIDIKIGPEEWKTCYHDSGNVMVRFPDLPPGNYPVRVRQDKGKSQVLGEILVPGDEGPKFTARIVD